MRNRIAIFVPLFLLASLFVLGIALAAKPSGAKNRIWAFEVAEQVGTQEVGEAAAKGAFIGAAIGSGLALLEAAGAGALGGGVTVAQKVATAVGYGFAGHEAASVALDAGRELDAGVSPLEVLKREGPRVAIAIAFVAGPKIVMEHPWFRSAASKAKENFCGLGTEAEASGAAVVEDVLTVTGEEAGVAAEGGGITLNRAVGPDELADIQALGKYRVPAGGTEGKYFFETPQQASNFARMMGDQPYTTTSVTVSPAQMGLGQSVNPVGEGPGFFFSTPDVPSGQVTIFNHSVLR